MKTHRYAEAAYEIVPIAGGAFGVKVSTSDASPATVTSFDTVAAAETWIVAHKGRVLSPPQARTVFRRPARRTTTDG